MCWMKKQLCNLTKSDTKATICWEKLETFTKVTALVSELELSNYNLIKEIDCFCFLVLFHFVVKHIYKHICQNMSKLCPYR